MQDTNSRLRERLIGALVGLANTADSHAGHADRETALLVCEALCAADGADFRALTGRVHAEKARIAPDCTACKTPCGRMQDYDMRLMRYDDENVRRLKENMLSSMRSAAQTARAAENDEAFRLLLQGLRAIGDTWDETSLIPLVQKIAQL